MLQEVGSRSSKAREYWVEIVGVANYVKRYSVTFINRFCGELTTFKLLRY